MKIKIIKLQSIQIQDMKTKTINGNEYIFDVVRKKYILNQPEEWVRQNMIEYLNKEKGYPISLMSIEKKNSINNLPTRCDLICHNSNGEPLLLVECKAPNIKLQTDTLNQIINYQQNIQAKYMMITNGKTHFCFMWKKNKFIFLKTIPEYKKNPS